ncbi:MAG: hypothetical protein HY275_07870 [Gemmatimonadetes bacterium]|nr:hypothetical protein [Gemmatimonadota bacterium]
MDASLARRFEVISRPFRDFVGVNAITGLLPEIGSEQGHAHVEALMQACLVAAKAPG